MQLKSMMVTTLLGVALTASGVPSAADAKPKSEQGAADPHGSQGHGMMNRGMTDMMGRSGIVGGSMMGMMNGCQQMMGSASMPQLPAGNEKLQLEMRAEMMQKMGEILGKYAARLDDGKRSNP